MWRSKHTEELHRASQVILVMLWPVELKLQVGYCNQRKAGIKKRGKKEPTPAPLEVAILVREEGRRTEREKWHM